MLAARDLDIGQQQAEQHDKPESCPGQCFAAQMTGCENQWE